MHTHTHYYGIKAIMLGAYKGWVLGLWVVIGWVIYWEVLVLHSFLLLTKRKNKEEEGGLYS
jgi:hypothetical protein